MIGISVQLETEKPEVLTRREQFCVSLKGWLPWAGKGSLAILDQGLFAGSNFLLNILLARWVAPNNYGSFSVAFSVFLLLSVFHTALLTEPMLVFGPSKYHKRLPHYLGILIKGHFALMIPGSLLLAGAAFLLGRFYSPEVGRALLALAIASPFVLLLWLLRRAFYILLNPGWASVGGGVYLLTLLTSTVSLHSAGFLTAATSLLAMGVSSLVTCLLLLVPLHPSWKMGSSATPTILADHWRYGKWVACAAIPYWLSDGVYFLVLPAWASLAESGALKAVLNLAMPALHTITALGPLLLPLLVRSRDYGGPGSINRILKLGITLFLVGSCCYLGLLWGARSEIFRVLYAGKYAEYAGWPLLLVGLLPFAQSLPAVMGSALRAAEQPKLVFKSCIASSLFTLAVGIPLASIMGVRGALIGLVASYLVMGIFMLLFFRRLSRPDPSLPAKLS